MSMQRDEIALRQENIEPEIKALNGTGPGPHFDEHLTVIRPPKGWVSLRMDEVWAYRELLYFLVWRDIKVRYKQTTLGAAWAIIQPFFTMVVFSVFFSKLGGIKTGTDIPYPVWSFCALVPWQLFAHALSESSNSLVSNERLVSKVYFPRLIIPMSAVLAGLVDFGIASVILLGMMAFYGIVPGVAVLMLPLFLLLAVCTALAVGLWLSALNVQYRDVRYTIPFLTQIWLFISPIAYPATQVPEQWRALYGLNPMAGVVEGFRWALLGTENTTGSMILVSAAVVLLLLVGGVMYFRKMERTFADVV